MVAKTAEDPLGRLVHLCESEPDLEALRRGLLLGLRKIMTVDAAFFATVDPLTLLFTAAFADEPLLDVAPLFLENEYGNVDVNKFTALASGVDHVRTLDAATQGQRATSARYREVMGPLKLGDELRAALVHRGRCWGVLCLHRASSGLGFTEREVRVVRRLVPPLALALRNGVLARQELRQDLEATDPGVVVLDHTGSLLSLSPEAEHWLNQLAPGGWAVPEHLPLWLRALVARTLHDPGLQGATPPAVRLRTRTGHWLSVTASRLVGVIPPQVAVVLAPATPGQLMPLLLDAHGLTPAQQRVIECVLRGQSTQGVVSELHISAYTMQEHLQAAFAKVGVRSRRELIAVLMTS